MSSMSLTSVRYCFAFFTKTIVESDSIDGLAWKQIVPEGGYRWTYGDRQTKYFHIFILVIFLGILFTILNIDLSIIRIIAIMMRVMRGRGSEKQTPRTGSDGYRQGYRKAFIILIE